MPSRHEPATPADRNARTLPVLTGALRSCSSCSVTSRTRDRGTAFQVLGIGGVVLGILVWQEGREAVGAPLEIGVTALAAHGSWAQSAQASGQAHAAGPGPV